MNDITILNAVCLRSINLGSNQVFLRVMIPIHLINGIQRHCSYSWHA